MSVKMKRLMSSISEYEKRQVAVVAAHFDITQENVLSFLLQRLRETDVDMKRCFEHAKDALPLTKD